MLSIYLPQEYWYEFSFPNEKKTINKELLYAFQMYGYSDCDNVFETIEMLKELDKEIEEEIEDQYFKDLNSIYLRYENGGFDTLAEYKKELKSLEEYYH